MTFSTYIDFLLTRPDNSLSASTCLRSSELVLRLTGKSELQQRSAKPLVTKSVFLVFRLCFFNTAGNMIDAGKLKKVFIKTVKDAGIKNFRFHDLRHTFATRLVQKGVDLYKVAKLFGHADISTTQRYAHHYPESLRDGVEILDKLDVKNDDQFHDSFTLRDVKAEGPFYHPGKAIEN